MRVKFDFHINPYIAILYCPAYWQVDNKLVICSTMSPPFNYTPDPPKFPSVQCNCNPGPLQDAPGHTLTWNYTVQRARSGQQCFNLMFMTRRDKQLFLCQTFTLWSRGVVHGWVSNEFVMSVGCPSCPSWPSWVKDWYMVPRLLML